MNVNERSPYTVISTGVKIPRSFSVRALKALQNSIIFTPCCPSASTRQKQRNQKNSRIFISVGRRDKIKVYDLTDWLVNKTTMTNADINAIDIHDNFSFFEVPTEHVEELLTAANGSVFKGRNVILEVAKEKSSSSSRREDRPSSSRGKSMKKTSFGEKKSSFGEKKSSFGEKKSYHSEIEKRRTRKPFEYDKKVENKKKKY